jgi:hypothetical protein
MNDQPDIRFEEIVVALESGTDCRVPIAFAAELAAGLRSRLTGLWLGDSALQSAAGYAFTQEITIAGGVREFSAATLNRDLSAQRETMRRLLASHAARRHLQWRLSQEQEEPVAGERLVVTAGVVRHRLPGGNDLLILAARPAPGPVSLVLGEGPANRRALRVARRLAEATDQPLEALLVDGENGEAGELRSLLAGIATATAPEPSAPPAERLRRIAASRHGGVLVVPRPLLEACGLAAEDLARSSRVPLLATGG